MDIVRILFLKVLLGLIMNSIINHNYITTAWRGGIGRVFPSEGGITKALAIAMDDGMFWGVNNIVHELGHLGISYQF